MHSSIKMGCFALLLSAWMAPQFLSAQNRPGSLPVLDSLPLLEMGDLVNQLQQSAKHALDVYEQETNKTRESLRAWESQWAAAKADTMLAKSTLDSLAKGLSLAKKMQKNAEKKHKNAKKTYSLTADLSNLDSTTLLKKLPVAWKKVDELYQDIEPIPMEAPSVTILAETASDVIITPAPAVVQSSSATPSSKNFVRYDPAADVMLHPPKRPCVMAASSRDEFSGEITHETGRAEIFRYTNPVLKNYLQGRTHIICEAALMAMGEQTTLLLTFTIQDPNARKAFGRLEKNSAAVLKFLDGSQFPLQSMRESEGFLQAETGATIFRTQYPLNKEAVQKIRRMELDKLRIAWSNGYEDYDVQQIDLLIQQANCLFEK